MYFVPPSSSMPDCHSYPPPLTLRLAKTSTSSDLSSNIFHFLTAISPCIPAPQSRNTPSPSSENNSTSEICLSALCRSGSPSVPLGEIWDFLDKPFGHEVEVDVDGELQTALFTPFLSAIQLFSNDIDTNGHDDDDVVAMSSSSAASPTSSSFLSSCSSTSSSSRANSTTSSATGSGRKLLFEFFERSGPDVREPLGSVIERLAEDYPPLVEAHTSAFDRTRSWFAISWCPLLCFQKTDNPFSGMFLTYHSLDIAAHPFWHLLASPKKSHHDQQADFATSQDNKMIDTLYTDQPPVLVPGHVFTKLIGFVPYKIQCAFWYCPSGPVASTWVSQCDIPSNLIRAAVDFVDNAREFSTALATSENDPHHISCKGDNTKLSGGVKDDGIVIVANPPFHPDLDHIRKGTQKPAILRRLVW